MPAAPSAVSLRDLPRLSSARIVRVVARGAHDPVAQRLGELGFVPGERVRVVALGPVGQEPIAVQVGFTRFALRRAEAERVVLDAASVSPSATWRA